MVTHRSLSKRTFPGMCLVFVLAAMPASCRGAGEPAAGIKAAADTAAPAPAPPLHRRRASSTGAGRST